MFNALGTTTALHAAAKPQADQAWAQRPRNGHCQIADIVVGQDVAGTDNHRDPFIHTGPLLHAVATLPETSLGRNPLLVWSGRGLAFTVLQ
jgi:hypothetical protein